MADLNSNSSSSAPLPSNGFTLESDDISILVHTFFQTSTAPSSSASLDASQHQNRQQRPPEEEIRRRFRRSAVFSDSSSGLNFSPQSDYAFSSAIASEIGGFGCQSEKDRDASDVQRKSCTPRSSSKRTRSTENHNLSEKRRRQRINEKMKALQKLIPNSNKTDKASMLDEAIEYLKQLQLQVQMLALRNGSALHPFYLPGVMHSGAFAYPNAPGICFNGEDALPSSSRGTGPLSADQKIPFQTVFNPSSRCASSDQRIYMPVVLETGNSECPFVLEPSTSAHRRPTNFVTPSKDLYDDCIHDVGRCGDDSSSGVSS